MAWAEDQWSRSQEGPEGGTYHDVGENTDRDAREETSTDKHGDILGARQESRSEGEDDQGENQTPSTAHPVGKGTTDD